MKVLHIITGLEDGGAEGVLYRICKHDVLNRHVVISLMNAGKYGPLLEDLGLKVYCLNMTSMFGVFRSLFEIRRIVRLECPDVVQTWMYHADLLGGIAAGVVSGIPTYWGVRNTTLVPGKSKMSTILIVWINAILSRVVPAGIIFCADRARVVHVSKGYRNPRMVVIPNGYNVDEFHPDALARQSLREYWLGETDVPIIGMVARFDPQKDHDNLFSALVLLRQQGFRFKCALIGTGTDADSSVLRGKLLAHGLAGNDMILCCGRRSDMSAVMNALDIHVLSSAYGEAFPNVLCEAMACGTPCVTTDVGDAAMIVGKTGWVVRPGVPTMLASALADALTELAKPDWSIRQHLVRQRIIDDFDIEKMVSAYHQQWGVMN